MRGRFRRFTAWILLPAAATASVCPALADGDKMGLTSYYFSDSGSNTVITTAFMLAKAVLEKTVLMIDIELDQVTVPPVTAVTGATRPQRRKGEPFEKNRGQVILGVEQGLGPTTTMAASVYRSQEVDYVSTAGILTFSQELFSRNTTVTLRGQYNFDKVGKILEAGDVTWQKKRVYTGALTFTQILSPTTVMDLSYDIVYMDGFLSDPYRQVRVFADDGSQQVVDEQHQPKRWRHAGSLRLSQYIPSLRASLIGGYRGYGDTWSVASHTAELKLNTYVFADLVLGLDYRYYTQTGSEFTRAEYRGGQYLADGFRTADYKLTAFSSNTVGISLTYLLRGLGRVAPDLEFLRDSSMEILYFRYFNDLDFSADILQANIKFSI